MTALFAALIVEKLVGLPAAGVLVVRDDDADRARRKRNIALGLTLAGVAILFYLMSIVKWLEHSGH